MIAFLLRTLIYAQSFFWLYVLFLDRYIRGPRTHEQVIKWFGIYFSACSYMYILVNDVSISQYTSFLLSFYILMILLCIGAFSLKYEPKDAIALSFLIVFINSYYWEFMLHFNVIMFYGLNFNQLIQAFHLIPAYYLIKRTEFNDPVIVKKKIIYGLMISGLNVVLLPFHYRFFVNTVTRLSTLYILIDIVLNDIKKIKKGF